MVSGDLGTVNQIPGHHQRRAVLMRGMRGFEDLREPLEVRHVALQIGPDDESATVRKGHHARHQTSQHIRGRKSFRR